MESFEKAVNEFQSIPFSQKVPLQMFDRVVKKPLVGDNNYFKIKKNSDNS